MIFEKTELSGVLIVKPVSYKDDRGYFFESFKKKIYDEHGITKDFVQDNVSKSIKGTTRGLHYQVGDFAQGKLCQVLQGKVLDVAVDIRFGSPTFGKYAVAELSDENHFQLWIPKGFAHGFSVLSDEAVFHYKCTQYYSKEHERSINYADPELAIDWRVSPQLVSLKDKGAKFLKDIEKDFLY